MTSIPEISARGSLILWAKFQIPVGPRSGREGEKCRPLDHMRQILSSTKLRSYPMLWSISIYIQNCSTYFFHVVFTLCLEILYICNLRMRSFQNPLFQGSAPFWSHFVSSNTLARDTARYCHENSIQMYHNTAQSTSEFCEFTKGKGVKRTLITPCHRRLPRVKRDVLFKPFKQLIIF